MKSRTRITVAQSQRLSLNASLSAAIRILRADAAGLSRFLEERAAENPALIVERPERPAPDWLPRWSDALNRMRGLGAVDAEMAALEPSLAAHVQSGISGLGLSGRPKRVAEALAEALGPAGWLLRPLAEIAEEAGVTLPEAETVLARVQQMEPAGLFARDLEECLRLQAVEAGELDALMDGVLRRLPMVAAGQIARIAQALGRPEAEVLGAVARLRRYDPKPGARFQAAAAPVVEPDLVARKGAEGWEVALNRGALPTLKLGSGPGRNEARALLRLVEGRNATLLRVAQEMLRRQPEVLDRGLAALRPMGMAEVAAALELHPTTVGRAVAGAAIDTPRGTWWLRALFSQPVGGAEGPAAAALRDRLARLVAEENPEAPLKDEDLARALSGPGSPVARRTVAKYRGMLGIPPARARRCGRRR